MAVSSNKWVKSLSSFDLFRYSSNKYNIHNKWRHQESMDSQSLFLVEHELGYDQMLAIWWTNKLLYPGRCPPDNKEYITILTLGESLQPNCITVLLPNTGHLCNISFNAIDEYRVSLLNGNCVNKHHLDWFIILAL